MAISINQIFQQIHKQHVELRRQKDDPTISSDILSNKAKTLLEEIRLAGCSIGNPNQRRRLESYTGYWGAFIFEQTGIYPDTALRSILICIFVSSPNDVQEERSRFYKVVEDLNKQSPLAERYDSKLRVLECQDVISGTWQHQEKKLEQGDIIEIMWMYFITSNDAFQKAALCCKKTQCPHVLFYQRTDDNSLLKEKMNLFLKELDKTGIHTVLYMFYKTPEEFENMIQRDLTELILRIVQDIEITTTQEQKPSILPEKKEPLIYQQFFSVKDFKNLLKLKSENFAKSRIIEKFEKKSLEEIMQHYMSTKEEMEKDWHNAEVSIASEILDGKINFAYKIDNNLYSYLEKIWLRDVKEFKAYLYWKGKGAPYQNNEQMDADYFEACKKIRQKLIDSNIKAPLDYFSEVKDYLETNYLDVEGKIDIEKADELIERKARRIWEVRKGIFEKEVNWYIAETYVRMFYENIIPAVMKINQEKEFVPTKCSIAQILKAFQFSKHPENRFLIINCFEAAIAIYFLDPNIIKELLEYPASCNFNIAYVKDWPKDLVNPSICRGKFIYDDRDKLIIYNGKMYEDEKDFLLNKVTDEEHKKAVENLYIQSNSDPKLMTL